jgi:hypothetical protein
MNYRAELYRLNIDRRVVAADLGLSYSAFNSRLGAFTRWKPSEEYRLQEIISKAEEANKLESPVVQNERRSVGI